MDYDRSAGSCGDNSRKAYYFVNAGRDKLRALLDHLKLEIVNEPEKIVVRRKK